MTVNVRPYTQEELQFATKAMSPAPLVYVGSLLRCTDANTSRFTHNSVYRVYRTAHNVKSGLQLPVIHDDSGRECVVTSLAFGLGHWVKAR